LEIITINPSAAPPRFGNTALSITPLLIFDSIHSISQSFSPSLMAAVGADDLMFGLSGVRSGFHFRA